MEKLAPIQQTLSEIDDRTPDALRVAFSLGYRVSPAPAPGEEDRVASFVASVLPPPSPVSEDADAKDPGELHEVPLGSISEVENVSGAPTQLVHPVHPPRLTN